MSHEATGDAHDKAFGFDDESWMGRLRAASTAGQGTLGSLGDFELLGQIGQGGQATVYKGAAAGHRAVRRDQEGQAGRAR